MLCAQTCLSWGAYNYTIETDQSGAKENSEPIIRLQVRKKLSCQMPFARPEAKDEFCYLNLHIQGSLLISQGYLAEQELGPGRAMLTLSINEMRILSSFEPRSLGAEDTPIRQEICNLDLLIPLLFKSYFISLGPVAVDLQGPARTEVESIDLKSGKFSLVVTQFL